MLIEVDTPDGPRKVRVCDYCRSVCIQSGCYCSGHCARNHAEWQKQKAKRSTQQERERDHGTDGLL